MKALLTPATFQNTPYFGHFLALDFCMQICYNSSSMGMWNTAVAINTLICSFLSIFLIYSVGMLILHGSWRLFLFALTVWLLSIVSELVISALDS